MDKYNLPSHAQADISFYTAIFAKVRNIAGIGIEFYRFIHINGNTELTLPQIRIRVAFCFKTGLAAGLKGRI